MTLMKWSRLSPTQRADIWTVGKPVRRCMRLEAAHGKPHPTIRGILLPRGGRGNFPGKWKSRLSLFEKPLVLRLVLGRGLRLDSLGVGIGVAAALPLMQLLSKQLFGVTPFDPLTFAGAAVLLSGVALLACFIPAYRATRVDPLVTLRHE